MDALSFLLLTMWEIGMMLFQFSYLVFFNEFYLSKIFFNQHVNKCPAIGCHSHDQQDFVMTHTYMKNKHHLSRDGARFSLINIVRYTLCCNYHKPKEEWCQ